MLVNNLHSSLGQLGMHYTLGWKPEDTNRSMTLVVLESYITDQEEERFPLPTSHKEFSFL